MQLKEIFDRDIFRSINPAVVVSDQKKETIDAEIREYVFTDDLIEKIYEMIDTILNKKSGKSGIWINGYYGSGKSHFIKYIHYLLDINTYELAFDCYEKSVEGYDPFKPNGDDRITVSNVKQLRNKISASQCDNIMFNVEDETDDGDQERLTRIFLNMFNRFRGYNSDDIPLAILLEKQLDKKGVFDQFKSKINEDLGFDWELDASQVAAFQLESVLDIAKSVYPELDTISLHNKLSNPEAYKVGINSTLIPELTSFLRDKESTYRLLFLVDEVSQYIGSNKEILLNFQNIIERISKDCNNQVWVACTAQQTLDDVSGGADGVRDVQDEFGKILGRFDTRISLQSNDASYITQRRVLDKNSKGIKELSSIYGDKKDYIENQFKINHELYKGYQNEDEFIRCYPFVPYQFKLIAHVFDAFQQLKFVIKEVKDNERSVLGITHFTVKEHSGDSMGGFISFDGFYNKQFYTNLTHRGTKAIENGLNLPYVKNNPFAQKVVKVLFMISNLLESQRQTFPSNLDNLTVLLMDKLDQNRKQLQNEIQEVLNRLENEGVVREEKGSYFFFNEDEMDVQNVIKSQVIAMEDRCVEFDELIRPMLELSVKFTFGQNNFKVGYSVESREFFRNGDFDVKVLITDKTEIDQIALNTPKMELVVCINEWFVEDDVLIKDFDTYCKTRKYFRNHSGGATGERTKTHENFKLRNNLLKDKLKATIERKFVDTRFVSQQQIIAPNEINGTKVKERINNVINKHLGDIYKNHHLSQDYAKTQAELKQSAAALEIPYTELKPAEVIVNDVISNNNGQMTVADILDNFSKPPFGWKHEAVLDMLIQLVKKKKREFQYRGQPRYNIVDFINKAVSTSERNSCEVITGEEIDQNILDNTIDAYNDIFNESIDKFSDGNELYDRLKDLIGNSVKQYQSLSDIYKFYPFGKPFEEVSNHLNSWVLIRDPKKLFSEIIEGKSSTKDLVDSVKVLSDFLERAFDEYKNIKSFYDSNIENFKELSGDDQEKANNIGDFLIAEDIAKTFREVRKQKQELEGALKALIDGLKNDIVVKYDKIFDELDAKAKELGSPSSCYADRNETIESIKRLRNITHLKNKDLGADDFKNDELKKIFKNAPVEEKVQEYKVSSGASTIKNQEELNNYISKIQADMEKILNDNKTIIIK